MLRILRSGASGNERLVDLKRRPPLRLPKKQPRAKYSVALLRGWTGGLFYDADLFKKSQAIIGETHPHFR